MAKMYKHYLVRFRERAVERMSRVMRQDNLLATGYGGVRSTNFASRGYRHT